MYAVINAFVVTCILLLKFDLIFCRQTPSCDVSETTEAESGTSTQTEELCKYNKNFYVMYLSQIYCPLFCLHFSKKGLA